MRYLMIYRQAAPESDAPPTEEEESAMGAFTGEMIANDYLLAKKFLVVAGDGESEARLIHDAPAFAPA